MNKNLQTILESLGTEYAIKNIDLEDCIYRDLGDFDIEISGCNKKNGPHAVYVWQKKPLSIVYRKQGIRTLRGLKIELNRTMEMNEARKHGIKWPEEV